MSKNLDAALAALDEGLSAIDRACPITPPPLGTPARYRTLTRYTCHDIIMAVPTTETAPPCDVCGSTMEVLPW